MAIRSPPRKATLFCPDCPHRSPPDGDWRRVEDGDDVRLVCPDCRASVVTRPRSQFRVRSLPR